MNIWKDHRGMLPRRVLGIFSILACWELDGCCSLYLGLDFWIFGFGVRNHFHVPPFDEVHEMEATIPGYGKPYRSRSLIFSAWARCPWPTHDFFTNQNVAWLKKGVQLDIPHPWRYAV